MKLRDGAPRARSFFVTLVCIATSTAFDPLFAQDEVEGEAEDARQGELETGAGESTQENDRGGAAAATREAEFQSPAIFVIGDPDGVRYLGGSGTLVTNEDIREQAYDDPNQALRRVPGVYLRPEDGFGLFPNISLRGVDTARSSKLTLMEDGILTAPAAYSAPEAYYSPTVGRMHAIEVLKGSSQIRFGPHTTGGVINFVSTPIPLDRKFYLRTLYGTDNEFRIHGFVGQTFDTESAWGKVGFLAEGWARRTDGFKTIDAAPDFMNTDDTGFHNIEPMLKLSWEPGTTIYNRFEFKTGYTDRDANESYVGLSEADFRSNPFRRYSATRFDNITTKHDRTYLRHTIEPTDTTRITTTGYYNEFARDWFKLDSVVDENGIRVNPSRALAENGTHLATLRGEAPGELRIRHNNRFYYSYGVESIIDQEVELGPTSHLFTGGIRYHSDKVRRDQHDENFTQAANGAFIDRMVGPPGGAGNREEESDAIAVFLEDQIRIGNLTLRPGIRYEHVDQKFADFNSGASGEGSVDVIAGGASAIYDFTSEWSAFVGVHRGFSVPGPSANIVDGLDEETSIGVELGPRYRNEQGWLAADATIFYTHFDDLIVVDNIGGAGTGQSENVGRVDTMGFELAASADPGILFDWCFYNPWWVSLTYTRAELANDSLSTDAESIFAGGVKGNRVPYIPDIAIGFGTGIDWDCFGVHVSGYYVDDMFTSASNTSSLTNPAGEPDSRFGTTDDYVVIDLSAYFRVTEQAQIFGGVQNIFDEEYIASRHPHGPRPGAPLFAYVGMEIDW